ncbi:MAG: 50S ribosomal protein P1 [Candidatus Aenigmarchaeota archaeon]|nr:50S ribosomal protein P1 [Candidatus Aenigmarchaeota archaeon]
MEMVYAALMLHTMHKPVDEKGIKKIVEAAGGEADAARIKALVGSLKDVNIDEAIKQTAVAAAPAAPAAVEGKKAAEAKPEEESAEDQEKKAEEAAGGLSSLFG